ncbi:MAG: replication restart helicase PriA [Cetobacterium sp.]
MRYYKIYIDGTNEFYTYCDEKDQYDIGDSVEVSFRNRIKGGIIISLDKTSEFSFKVLPIKKKLESQLSYKKEFIKLLLWIRDYYMCSFDQVFSAAIPAGLNIKYEKIYYLNENKKIYINENLKTYFLEKSRVRLITLKKYFSKERIKEAIEEKVLIENDKWYTYEEINKSNFKDFKEFFHKKKSIGENTLTNIFSQKEIEMALKNNELIEERRIKNFKEKENEIILEHGNLEFPEEKKLNEEQENVKNGIINSTKKHFLIKGITGSGKTEVYINLIRKGLEKGRGSIFLVPEISLTPQMVKRFQEEFGENIAILHSKMTSKERAQEWYELYTGNKKIVLGVRSAIFAPVKDLEYIIIDEEHENSYKQDSNPRYNAKYVAIKRGELEGAKIVLGSATPSIESYYYGKKGIFELYYMNHRYKNAKLPGMEVVDMKEENNSFFSEKLLKAIRETLLRKEQVILLLNRKGYSTLIQCGDCGYIEECEHCSIKMNYYSSGKILKCNYCGITKKFTGHCSSCGSTNLIHSGKGVERVEEELKKYFPVEIIRVDGDVSKEKNFYENMYKDFSSGKYKIMIGTQMIAKGLHFPNVTLVGVINGDTVLSIPDFRSGERTYQLITQVAGRAGRGDKEGKVIIQTYQPESYVIKKILEDDYEGFYNREIENREILFYPPFSKIINIGISSTKEDILEKISNEIAKEIKDENVEIHGPMKSLVYKVKDRYRYNIFIKGKRENINKYKFLLGEKLKKFKGKDYRVVVDIDPINLI